MAEDLGTWGEEFVADFLTEKGWRIVERNYENQLGECDLIAEDEDTLVFVEVKTRTGSEFGVPEAAVTRDQRDHLRRVARSVIAERGTEIPCRFDVVAVEFDGDTPELRHIPNAFGARE